MPIDYEIRHLRSKCPSNEPALPHFRREIHRKLCFSLTRNNRLRLPAGEAIRFPGRAAVAPAGVQRLFAAHVTSIIGHSRTLTLIDVLAIQDNAAPEGT